MERKPVHPERQIVLKDQHKHFIQLWAQGKIGKYEYAVTEHLRISGMYWGLTALYLLDSIDVVDREEVIIFHFLIPSTDYKHRPICVEWFIYKILSCRNTFATVNSLQS